MPLISLDEMKKVISAGGSVLVNGAIVNDHSKLPSPSLLAKLDPSLTASSLTDIESQLTRLQREKDALLSNSAAPADRRDSLQSFAPFGQLRAIFDGSSLQDASLSQLIKIADYLDLPGREDATDKYDLITLIATSNLSRGNEGINRPAWVDALRGLVAVTPPDYQARYDAAVAKLQSEPTIDTRGANPSSAAAQGSADTIESKTTGQVATTDALAALQKLNFEQLKAVYAEAGGVWNTSLNSKDKLISAITQSIDTQGA